MKFPYRKIDLKSPFSNKFIYRPIIPISLQYKDKRIHYEALIDSGADFTILPIGLIEVLGIDVSKCKKVNFTGVDGDILGGIIAKVILGVEKNRYITNLVFAEISGVTGILGQLGFFDFFTVSFSLSGKEIGVSIK